MMNLLISGVDLMMMRDIILETMTMMMMLRQEITRAIRTGRNRIDL